LEVPTLESQGIDKDLAKEARRLASWPKEKFEEAIRQWVYHERPQPPEEPDDDEEVDEGEVIEEQPVEEEAIIQEDINLLACEAFFLRADCVTEHVRNFLFYFGRWSHGKKRTSKTWLELMATASAAIEAWSALLHRLEGGEACPCPMPHEPCRPEVQS
jgi:hypothetical protein